MKLTVKQTRALDLLEDQITGEVYYGGAAGGGKSMFGCYWQLKRRFKYPGTRGLIGRSELKNLKKTTLNSLFEVCKMQGLKADQHYRYNQQESIIYFPNGSQIILADLFSYPSDPFFDSLGSLEITDGFIDEAPQVTEKARNIVKSRIRYKLDEFGLIPKLLMAGNPSKNWAYYDFYLPSKQGVLRKDRQFIQALVTDNPYISPHYIESLKGLDRNSRERLLNGNWEYDDDPAALINYEAIMNCFSNNFDSLKGEKYITVDVARFGSDKTVIGLWDGFKVKMYPFKGLSITETARKVLQMQIQHEVPLSNVIADEDGVGGGVVDITNAKGFVNNSRPLINPVTKEDENYNNLKSQCYYKLAERINSGGLYIQCEDVDMRRLIIQELEQVKQHNMDKDGKRQVLPKDKVKEIIGRSPDFSDTLMMREYFELAPKLSWIAF
jgi:phage terminase large subunit